MSWSPPPGAPSLGTKLFLIAWMLCATACFVLVFASGAAGSMVAEMMPKSLLPLQSWLQGIFHAPTLY